METMEEFISIYTENITRKGSAEFLEWLKGTDFFRAPASTKFHCACEGGLAMHSVSVYKTLLERYFEEGIDNPESFAICGLLHDVCKIQFYKKSWRNVKNDETGQWEKRAYYAVEDGFPYGHGEKSVFFIERFMRLKLPEAMAIRWHMGGFDEAVRGGSFALSQAYEKFPLAVKLHLADLESTYLREHDTSTVRFN